jgi:hypothetical protein
VNQPLIHSVGGGVIAWQSRMDDTLAALSRRMAGARRSPVALSASLLWLLSEPEYRPTEDFSARPLQLFPRTVRSLMQPK